MFTKQIGTLIQSLKSWGMSDRMADVFSIFGNCTAPLHHAGPIEVDYEWPENADLENHAAMTLRTQGTALNIPQGDLRMGNGTNIILSDGAGIVNPDGVSVLSGYKVVKLTTQLSAGGTATGKVQKYSGGSWIDKTPTETITVYDAFLTGDEILTTTTRIGVNLTDQGIYVASDSQSN